VKPAILVIKLGALGDVVQALGPFAAIRRHHVDARITLLTTRPFVALARASGCFDDIWTDDRPRLDQVGGWLALRRRLRGGDFRRVYDLQTSQRSSRYFRLFWPGPYPEWSGIARGASHRHANPARDAMHTLERQAEQLRIAGIDAVPPPELSWAEGRAADGRAADGDIDRFGIGGPFVLLAPGGAAHRPEKRWPADRFAALATRLAAAGRQPVLVGAGDEAPLHAAIRAEAPEALGLAGATSLLELAALARRADAAVGNDTGPMHLAAVAGCPSVVLYSHASDPALCAQRGPKVAILRAPSTTDIPVDRVSAALAAFGVA
jgi:ADP-heptose:LPS heptosyltransferase